jgi:hypothetical protein
MIELFDCSGMSARISERQCKLNQDKCRRLAGQVRRYLRADQISQPKIDNGPAWGNEHWGVGGFKGIINPLDLACLECERYDKNQDVPTLRPPTVSSRPRMRVRRVQDVNAQVSVGNANP